MKNETRKTEGQMTVAQLRELLRDVDGAMLVATEGCDCVGPSDGISIEDGKLYVLRGEER